MNCFYYTVARFQLKPEPFSSAFCPVNMSSGPPSCIGATIIAQNVFTYTPFL